MPVPHITQENFTSIAEQMTEQFLQTCGQTEEDGWKIVNEAKNGVVVSRKVNTNSTSNLDLLREPEKMFETVANPNHLTYVDKYFKSCEELHRLDDVIFFSRYIYKFPLPFLDREFICLEVNKQVDENTWIAIAGSVTTDMIEIPKLKKKHERGEIFSSGYLVKKTETGGEITTLMQADPKGNLPAVLVNMDAPKQPLMLALVRDLVQTGKITNKNKI